MKVVVVNLSQIEFSNSFFLHFTAGRIVYTYIDIANSDTTHFDGIW